MLAILAFLAAVTEPKPIGIFVTNDDYPAEAVRQRWEGTVQFSIVIKADGRVGSCTILASSGHPVLDDQTCSLMMRRGNFEPARDAGGQAVQAEAVRKMHWVLPSGPLRIPQPYRNLSISQTSDGPRCTVDWDGHLRTIKQGICKRMVQAMRSPTATNMAVFKVSVEPEELVPE